MTTESPDNTITDRIRAIDVWLDEAAPYTAFDQRHLDAASSEQAYWHLGYRSGLRDALSLLQSPANGTTDTTNHFRSNEPGE
jgi:hypothetical protein